MMMRIGEAVKVTIDGYRNKWEIIREMLKLIQVEDKAKKTRIYHKAYMDWNRFNRHFDFLLKENYICCSDEKSFILTEDGRELLKKLEELNGVLNKKAGSNGVGSQI